MPKKKSSKSKSKDSSSSDKDSGKSKKKKAKSSNWLVWLIKHIFLGIWYILKGIFFFFYWTFKGIFRHISRKLRRKPKRPDNMKPSPVFSISNKLKRKKSSDSKDSQAMEQVKPIRVLETLKGNFDTYWKKLNKSDSLIGIILGARGSGKTAIAMSIFENLENSDRNYFAMGFPSKDLPNWIRVVEGVDDLENDSYVVIDEGGILFSSRDSMSNANKLLSDLLFIARHKNLTIFFISQNSSNLEVNTLRQADFLILKKSSLLQKNFERKIVADIYSEHQEQFEKYKAKKGLALVYSDDFLGFIENDLPSFWSKKVSKAFK